MRTDGQTAEPRAPNHSHAWRGTWNRPMNIDENSQHALTIARMTDHNVRGVDEGQDERRPKAAKRGPPSTHTEQS